MEFNVEFGCELARKMVSDVKWPKGTLIVGLRRGAKELVPQGSTVIMPGDYLVVLSSEETEDDIRNSVKALCHAKS